MAETGGVAVFAGTDDVLAQAAAWHDQGLGVALATVVETWGSSPRPTGSQLVVNSDGDFMGSVSGGCIEGAVVLEALEVIKKGKPKRLDFGAGKHPAAVVTNIDTGTQSLVLTDHFDVVDSRLGEAIKTAMRADRSGIAETDHGPVFIQVFNPPLRLIVVGAVHIAQALAPMAAIAGYDVTIVDPRRAFATDARFPELSVRTDWPDDAIRDLAPDGRTAVVTLTHDPKLDDPALAEALRSNCFYVGSLGSKKTHAARLARLTEAGFDADTLGRIHGPIGLDIGAKSPAEIAVSILGEITAALRRDLPA